MARKLMPWPREWHRKGGGDKYRSDGLIAKYGLEPVAETADDVARPPS
jgi:hypothetical protein